MTQPLPDRRRLLLLAALAASAMPARAATGPSALLREWIASTHGASAEFSQTVTDDKGHVVTRSSGTFAFERPGRFRWTYLTPSHQDIVSDGSSIWVWDADLEQATQSPASHALSATPAALLAGGDVERLFAFEDQPDADGLQWVRATPRSPDTAFDWVRIGLRATARGPELVGMQLRDAFRRTSTIDFSDMRRNPDLPAATFRFTPPAGASVIRQR